MFDLVAGVSLHRFVLLVNTVARLHCFFQYHANDYHHRGSSGMAAINS